MPKKPSVITVMDSQHVKGSKTLHESPQQYFPHIFWSIRKQISSGIFVFVVSLILRLFVNILTPNHKHSLSVKASI